MIGDFGARPLPEMVEKSQGFVLLSGHSLQNQ
jgi:hypothetical protein